MSFSILRQQFLATKQELIHQIFQTTQINSLDDLARCRETLKKLQTLFSEALAQQPAMEEQQEFFSRSISKVLKLSAADSTAFLIALSTLGLEYMQRDVIPGLKEIAFGAVLASQCFSKMSDYFSVKTQRQTKAFEMEKKAFFDILKDELLIKIALKTLDIAQAREIDEPIQNVWVIHREIFIAALQTVHAQAEEICLSDDEQSQLLA